MRAAARGAFLTREQDSIGARRNVARAALSDRAVAANRRSELAVEVRVLWGTDLVRVMHVAPPRTIGLSEALTGCGAALGEPIVIAANGGVSARVPDARGSRAVLLSLGGRVSMIVPPSFAGSVYRAPPDAGGGAPIVIEVALVCAEEATPRAPLAGTGRGFAATAALWMAGALAVSSAFAPPIVPFVDDEAEPSVEQRYVMAAALQAVAEREAAEAEQREGVVSHADDAPVRWKFERWGEEGWQAGLWWPALPRDEREDLPLEALRWGEAMPFEPACWSGPMVVRERVWPLGEFATAFHTLRDGAFGLRLCDIGERASLGGDGLRNRPSALWFAQLAAARRQVAGIPDASAERAKPAKVRIAPIARGTTARAPDDVDRMVRGRLRDVRACLDVRRDAIDASEHIDVRVRVGRDGAATNAEIFAGHVWDLRLEYCAARALDGVRVAPSSESAGNYEYRISFGDGAR